MSHPRNMMKPPSRLNPNCPSWFEQKCLPPTLPPLSPQYQTFSSTTTHQQQMGLNPQTLLLNTNPTNNNYQQPHHNCSHTHNHTPNTSHTHYNTNNTNPPNNNNNYNNYNRSRHQQQQQQRLCRHPQNDNSSNTMPIIGNNNNNYQPMPTPLSLAQSNNNQTFISNMYNNANNNSANTMSTMSNTTNNSTSIPTPFGHNTLNNPLLSQQGPIPMIPQQQQQQTMYNNNTNKNVFNSNNSLSPKPKPNTNRNTRQKKTKTVNKNKNNKGKNNKNNKKLTEKEKKELQLLEYKKKVKGWWIGQRIVVETQDGDKITGRIKDYYPSSDKVQIWYDNDDSTFETIKLNDLLNWSVPSIHKICQYNKLKNLKYKIIDYIPKSNKYKPMNIPLLQRVQVLYRDGKWYTAFIDGYDPVSRRHHINYGDTKEWLWTTKERIKPINIRIMDHVEDIRTEIELNGSYANPPPWSPEPYGLDESFAEYSDTLNDEDGNNNINKTATKSIKKKTRKTKSRKMSLSSSDNDEYINSNDDSDNHINKKSNKKKTKNKSRKKRKNSDVSSMDIPTNKRQRVMPNSSTTNNIINNTSTTIMVNNNFMDKHNKNKNKNKNRNNRNNSENKIKSKIKPKKKLPMPSKPPPPKKRKKNTKYPRIAELKREIWTRTYSKEEKKYFWCCKNNNNNNGNKSSWNPWNDYNLAAPWMSGRQKWTKFKDDTNKPYYYNYDDGKSTYKKPKDYMSAEEIDHDSAEDDSQDDDDEY